MNLTKIFLLICAVLTVIYFSYVLYKQEKDERNLRATNKIVYAEIIELEYRKQGFIKFRFNGKEIGQRIYLSKEEYNELKNKSKIGLKIDDDENIIFANESYNDWSEAESFSILALGTFFIFFIIYYGIIPEIKKNKFKKGANILITL